MYWPGRGIDAGRRCGLGRSGRRAALDRELLFLGDLGADRGWLGPASQSIASAAAPYAAWLNTTAAQAEQTANQARAAAAAYEAAFAATVPPPVVAANRTELTSLLSTNVFGQNTAAVAANEAQYASMSARDSAAMYGYAGQSATASSMAPFDPPAQNTNPSGTAGQSAAVAQTVGSSTGADAQSALAQLTSATPNALRTSQLPSRRIRRRRSRRWRAYSTA